MNILYLIPARGGSKGIPKKNIVDFCGKPLIAWTIEAALKAKNKGKVVVSTDSKEIETVAKTYGADVPFLRPAEFSGDKDGALGVIKHAVDYFKDNEGWLADVIVYLQPTSPLRLPTHINQATKVYADEQYDVVVSVEEVPHNMLPSSLMAIDDSNRVIALEKNVVLDRHIKTKNKLYARNGPAVLVIKASFLKLNSGLYSGDTGYIVMDKVSSVDIDDFQDLEIARSLAMQRLSV